MDNQFVFCSKCGTRNFADDKKCGVCKNKLNSLPAQEIIQQTDFKNSPGTWIILIVIAFFFYYAFFHTSDKKDNAVNATVTNSSWDASVYQVENYLKNKYLSDPDSYKSISWSEVVKLTESKEKGFACYQVRHKYRAKNAFGGYVVEEKLFKLDIEGNIVDVRDFQR